MVRPDYPIETARLVLRPFAPDDVDDVVAFRSRRDVARYLYTEPQGADEVRALLRTAAQRDVLAEAGDELNLAVVRRDTGRVIGDVLLVWRSAEHRSGEIGFIFHPDHHGQGFAREATEVMLGLGFDGLGLHRVVGRCHARNTASAGLMERLGMRREAHFVRNEWVKGEWADEVVYALLDDEWRSR